MERALSPEAKVAPPPNKAQYHSKRKRTNVSCPFLSFPFCFKISLKPLPLQCYCTSLRYHMPGRDLPSTDGICVWDANVIAEPSTKTDVARLARLQAHDSACIQPQHPTRFLPLPLVCVCGGGGVGVVSASRPHSCTRVHTHTLTHSHTHSCRDNVPRSAAVIAICRWGERCPIQSKPIRHVCIWW